MLATPWWPATNGGRQRKVFYCGGTVVTDRSVMNCGRRRGGEKEMERWAFGDDWLLVEDVVWWTACAAGLS